MAEDREARGIAQFKLMCARWANQDSEFRQFVARRRDTLNKIGAGNTSGVLAIAVFLTSGTRAGWISLTAKLALGLFVIGTAAYVAAYRSLYFFETDIEDALLILRSGAKVDDKKVLAMIVSSFKRSEGSGIAVATSLVCLVIAVVGCCIGLLVM